MGQITTTQNLVAIKEVRHAGQKRWYIATLISGHIRLPVAKNPIAQSKSFTIDSCYTIVVYNTILSTMQMDES